MRALILCAGKGTRLRPLTYFTPKPLIKVDGKPVVRHLINHLRRFGINEIMINIHYKPKAFMKELGREVLYFYEPYLLGEDETVRQIYLRYPFFTDEFLVVMNGDTLTDVNLLHMFEMAKGKNIRYMDHKSGVYAGAMILNPKFLSNGTMSSYFDSRASWIDIGTFDGLKEARDRYEKLGNLS